MRLGYQVVIESKQILRGSQGVIMKVRSMLFGAMAVLGVLSQAGAVRAADAAFDEGYFTIQDVVVTESVSSAPVGQASVSLGAVAAEIGEVAVAVDQVIALGQKVWTIVKDGQPVHQTQWAAAAALPLGVTSWAEMSGWQAPQARVLRYQYTNVYGMTVIDFQVRVTYTYGGSYDGQGAYLTGVSVQPLSVQTAWGYTLNAKANVLNAVNMGSLAAPLAGMEIGVYWSIETVMKKGEFSASVYVDGKGGFRNLTNGTL